MNIPDIIKSDLASIGHPKLFGSRSMATRPAKEGFVPSVTIGSQITASTDWDFSQQYSPEIHHYLVSAGFAHYTSEQLSPYADDLTLGVYIKEYSPKWDWKNPTWFSQDDIVKVNIVLHSNEALFRRVWNSIDAEFYYKYLWKRGPRFDYLDNDLCTIKSHIKEVMNQLLAIAKEGTYPGEHTTQELPEKILERLDAVEKKINSIQTPPPSTFFCDTCRIEWKGVAGYVCPRTDCSIQSKVTTVFPAGPDWQSYNISTSMGHK